MINGNRLETLIFRISTFRILKNLILLKYFIILNNCRFWRKNLKSALVFLICVVESGFFNKYNFDPLSLKSMICLKNGHFLPLLTILYVTSSLIEFVEARIENSMTVMKKNSNLCTLHLQQIRKIIIGTGKR